jgi:hypothetical protein
MLPEEKDTHENLGIDGNPNLTLNLWRRTGKKVSKYPILVEKEGKRSVFNYVRLSCLNGRAGTTGRQAWQLPGAQRLITIFLILVNSLLCGIYFCDISSYGRKTYGHIISLDNCPSSSEYDIAKPTDFSEVTDEFSSVKARKFTLYICNCTWKILICCILCFASTL